jgi:hypothetical protein
MNGHVASGRFAHGEVQWARAWDRTRDLPRVKRPETLAAGRR